MLGAEQDLAAAHEMQLALYDLPDRLANEYGLPAEFETTAHDQVRWIASDDKAALEAFVAKHRSAIATDLDGDPVFLAPSASMLQWTAERTPELRFTDVKNTLRA